MNRNFVLIICLFVFEIICAQNDSRLSEGDIFYTESEIETSKPNSNRVVSKNTNSNKGFINGLVSNKKPFFLTRKSGEFNYFDSESDEYEYSFLYQLETYDPNELRAVPLSFKQVLYPVKSINDSIIQVKSYSDTYFLSTKKAIEYGEISELPIEFEDSNLDPIVYYFKSINNKSNINNTIKCYVDSVLDKYDWLNEFVKYDYSNLITQKVIENVNSYQISNDHFYKVYESNFEVFNFDSKTFSVNLNKLLSQSDFFNNDFKNQLFIENSINSKNWIYDNFDFDCSNEEARKITDLFDFDRNAIVTLELKYINNLNSCDCNSCDYQNNFKVKSLIITSVLNKELSVKITFD
jgi:hypothetical protein